MDTEVLTSNLIGIAILLVLFLIVYENIRRNWKESHTKKVEEVNKTKKIKNEYLEEGTIAIPESVITDYLKKQKTKPKNK